MFPTVFEVWLSPAWANYSLIRIFDRDFKILNWRTGLQLADTLIQSPGNTLDNFSVLQIEIETTDSLLHRFDPSEQYSTVIEVACAGIVQP